MIDVTVRTFAFPELRIKTEMGGHVFVHKLLKIDPQGPVASHDEVGTDTFVRREIAPRIGQIIVSGIVIHRFPGAFQGGSCKILGELFRAPEFSNRLLLVCRRGLGSLRLQKGNNRPQEKETDCDYQDEKEPASEETGASRAFFLPRLMAGRFTDILDWLQIQHGSGLQDGFSVVRSPSLSEPNCSQFLNIYLL